MKHLTSEMLAKRFTEVKELEGRSKQEPRQDRTKASKPTQEQTRNNQVKNAKETVSTEETQKKETSGLSKNDIIRTVIRIKPYL